MAEEGSGFAGARLIGRSNLRRQWRGIVVVTLLVAIAGTVVLATAAGARRTATSFERFTKYSHPGEAEVFLGTGASAADLAEFERDPQVGELAPLYQYTITSEKFGGELPAMAAALDDRFGTVVDRAKVVEGRLANNAVVDEVNLSDDMAERLGVSLGDRLELDSMSPAQVEIARRENRDPGPPAGPHVSLRVVGIVLRPLDLAPRGGVGGVVVLTPAFHDKYQGRIGSFVGTLVRMRPAQPDQLDAAIDAARQQFGEDPQFGIQSLGVETEGIRDAIDVLAVALALFAAIAGAASVIFITIIVIRQVAAFELDQPQLAALGVTRRSRVLGALLPTLPIIFGGALLGCVGAALASPLFPIGIARRAEINRGFSVDWSVAAAGFAAIALLTALIAFVAALRATAIGGDRQPAPRPSRVAQGAARAGWPITTSTGLRFAFESRLGKAAVPVRSAIAGAIIGVAGVAAVVVFVTSFDALLATPRQYGWSLGVLLRYDEGNTLPEPGACGLDKVAAARDPQFASLTMVCQNAYEVDDRPVDVWGFRPMKGDADPTIVRGRAADTPDEITLGRTTMDAIGKDIGERVTVQSPATERSYEIVGQQVLPSGATFDTPVPMVDNAGLTEAGFRALMSDGEQNGNFSLFGEFAPGRGLGTELHPESGFPLVAENGYAVPPTIPAELDRMRQVDRLPLLLGAFLAFLGVAALTHALFTSARRRRRDIAILRAVGFRRRQVRAAIGWQASALALVGLVIGIPIGIMLGRAVWTQIAEGLGVAAVPSTPVIAILVIGIATLFVVNVIALLAARRVTHVPPAAALTVE